MNAIANFRKRREAQRAQQCNVATAKAEVTAAPENEALALLAAVLKCDQQYAIAKAKELIALAESEGLDFVIGLGGEALKELQVENADKETVTEPGDKAEHTATDLEASAGAVEDAAANVAGAADTVDAAADKVSDAAGDLDATANQLAYSAEDIGTATAELKEATAELKKPSAARQSSRGKTTGKPAASSKKSG